MKSKSQKSEIPKSKNQKKNAGHSFL